MNIQTFIFLDMETTGLPREEGNKTKITEMCIAIVQADHISLGVFPRVLNKLNFCFNPLKSITPICKDLTGLSNELLQYQSEFQKNTVEIINCFLALQRKPLCLVAHNGNNFDYPILQAEIYNAGGSLPDDILCIDTLQAFRELEHENSTNELDIHDLPTQVNVPVEFCDGFDDLLLKVTEEVELSVDRVQQANEKTPTKKMKLCVTDYFVPYKANTRNVNDLYYVLNTVERNCRASRNEENKKQSCFKEPTASSQLPSNFRRQSYKLTEVYTRLTNKEPFESHKAEYDCSMLIECAVKIGKRFISWSNVNARKLSDVPMMQPERKFGC